MVNLRSCCCRIYIGSTQNSVKKRMQGHYVETRSLVNDGRTSDTFAKHFASHFSQMKEGQNKKKSSISINQIRKKGKPISNMKTFGELCCTLYKNERLEIIKANKIQECSLLIK